MDTAIGHKENTKIFAMCIVVDTEKMGTGMGHMMRRTTYHTYCYNAVVTDMVTELGHSKNTESFDVCIVVDTERVARGKGYMKNITTYHIYSVVNGHRDRL